jgi:RNA polymerase sigma-70 factor (ECF subfamily)
MYAISAQELTDQQLVEYFQTTADKRYFGLIYQRYYEKVYHCCLGILKDRSQASDSTQDIMLIVMEKLPQLRDGKLLSFWIYRISKNEAFKAAKVSARHRTSEINANLNRASDAEGKAGLLDHERQLIFVRRALRELKPIDRQIVVLKYFKEASILDLQQETGLSASAVKMRLLRARGQLLNLFRQNGSLDRNAA